RLQKMLPLKYGGREKLWMVKMFPPWQFTSNMLLVMPAHIAMHNTNGGGSINKKPMVSCHGSPVSKGAFSMAMAKNKEPSVINLKLVFVTKYNLDRLNYP
ncbi:MAG: hypothetical protein JST58_13075, partial [Bacteroidetes bacterium]|nr:hypothetical protein [Bacteroidota bacterium]